MDTGSAPPRAVLGLGEFPSGNWGHTGVEVGKTQEGRRKPQGIEGGRQ